MYLASVDRGWAGTSLKPLVIGRHPRQEWTICWIQALSLLSLSCHKAVREAPRKPQPNKGDFVMEFLDGSRLFFNFRFYRLAGGIAAHFRQQRFKIFFQRLVFLHICHGNLNFLDVLLPVEQFEVPAGNIFL